MVESSKRDMIAAILQEFDSLEEGMKVTLPREHWQPHLDRLAEVRSVLETGDYDAAISLVVEAAFQLGRAAAGDVG